MHLKRSAHHIPFRFIFRHRRADGDAETCCAHPNYRPGEKS